jgi:transposase-like protein
MLPPTADHLRGCSVPPRKKIELPDHVRSAVLDDLLLVHMETIAAEEREKIRIHLAVEQGLTTAEIASRLEVSQSVVSKWRKQGEEARDRRFGGGAVQPRELGADG